MHGDKGAEFILAAALMLNFGIPGFVTDKEQGPRRPRYGGTVAGKTATLLGVGAIGIGGGRRPAVARRRGDRRDAQRHIDADLDRCIAVSALRHGAAADRHPGFEPAADAGDARPDRPPSPRPAARGRRAVVVGRAAVFDYDALADGLADGAWRRRARRLSAGALAGREPPSGPARA